VHVGVQGSGQVRSRAMVGSVPPSSMHSISSVVPFTGLLRPHRPVDLPLIVLPGLAEHGHRPLTGWATDLVGNHEIRFSGLVSPSWPPLISSCPKKG
jgi:hypothetical protein